MNKTIRKIGIEILCLLVLVSYVNAFGISPASIEVKYEPNLKKNINIEVFNDEKKNLSIWAYSTGELEDYISFPLMPMDLRPEQPSKVFSYVIELPKNFEKEGVLKTDVVIVSSTEENFGQTKVAAKIGRPVKWEKYIEKAENETVYVNITALKDSVKVKEVKNKTDIENITLTVHDEEKLLDKLLKVAKLKEDKPKNINMTIEISSNNTEVFVEYYTEAPSATEDEISKNKKRITISSDMHYENVLAFTNISEVPQNKIKLYWIKNNTRELFTDVTYNDTNNNSLIDRIEWIVPHLSNQTFEIEIVVLNVQSYPTVGGEWEVRFTTTGTANLTISTVNGTNWSNINETYDLKLLDIKCGSQEINYTWINNTAFIEDYYCPSTGYETSKVITPGKHHLMFIFGDDVAYANNMATGLECNVTTNCTWTPLFYMSNFTNAHAGYNFSTETNDYEWTACCRVTGDYEINISVSNESGDTELLGFSNFTNAHVERPGTTNYDKLWMSMDWGTLICNISTNDCAADYGCVATMSNYSNGHMADCDGDGDDYNYKICCGFDNLAPDIIDINISPAVPTTQDDLYCNFMLNETNGSETLNVDWFWYNNSVQHMNGTISVTNHTWYNLTLNYENTTLGEIWTCRVEPRDQRDRGKNASVAISVSVSGVPVMYTSRIDSQTGTVLDELEGWCNATDADGDNLSYYWIWYKNSALFSSGKTTKNINESNETNIVNMTTVNLIKGDNWTISCKAWDGIENSSWMNSSNYTIINVAPTDPTLYFHN